MFKSKKTKNMNKTLIAAKWIRVRENNFSEEQWDRQQINRDPVTSETFFTSDTDYVKLVCGPILRLMIRMGR